MSLQIDYRTNARRVDELHRHTHQLESVEVKEVEGRSLVIKYKTYGRHYELVRLTREALEAVLTKSGLMPSRRAHEFAARAKATNYVEHPQQP